MEKKQIKISLQTALIICLLVLVLIFITEVIVSKATLAPTSKNQNEINNSQTQIDVVEQPTVKK